MPSHMVGRSCTPYPRRYHLHVTTILSPQSYHLPSPVALIIGRTAFRLVATHACPLVSRLGRPNGTGSTLEVSRSPRAPSAWTGSYALRLSTVPRSGRSLWRWRMLPPARGAGAARWPPGLCNTPLAVPALSPMGSTPCPVGIQSLVPPHLLLPSPWRDRRDNPPDCLPPSLWFVSCSAGCE